jgi:hypothetical protein
LPRAGVDVFGICHWFVIRHWAFVISHQDGLWHNRAVRRRWIIVVSVACALVAGGMIWFSTREREPRYNGRTLSEWLKEMWPVPSNGYAARNPDQIRARQIEAEEAVKHIGTNAMPCLVRWIRYEPRLPKLFSWLPTEVRPFERSGGESRIVYAYEAFAFLGSEAGPAVPELMRAMGDKNLSPRVAWQIESALSFIGEPALEPALAFLADTNQPNRSYVAGAIWRMRRPGPAPATAGPVLVGCLGDPDDRVATRAAAALAYLRVDPAVTVPALTNALRDPRPAMRSAAAQALHDSGSSAGLAVPALIQALKDPATMVRIKATEALSEIAPEALEEAETK